MILLFSVKDHSHLLRARDTQQLGSYCSKRGIHNFGFYDQLGQKWYTPEEKVLEEVFGYLVKARELGYANEKHKAR